jgi:hypothetical protein
MRRKIFSAVQEHCPPENFCFTIRYSPFATRRRFTIRHSLFAAVSRLADLPISRFADKFWLGRSLALPRCRRLKSVAWLAFDCVINPREGTSPVTKRRCKILAQITVTATTTASKLLMPAGHLVASKL